MRSVSVDASDEVRQSRWPFGIRSALALVALAIGLLLVVAGSLQLGGSARGTFVLMGGTSAPQSLATAGADQGTYLVLKPDLYDKQMSSYQLYLPWREETAGTRCLGGTIDFTWESVDVSLGASPTDPVLRHSFPVVGTVDAALFLTEDGKTLAWITDDSQSINFSEPICVNLSGAQLAAAGDRSIVVETRQSLVAPVVSLLGGLVVSFLAVVALAGRWRVLAKVSRNQVPWAVVAVSTLIGVALRSQVPAALYWFYPHDDLAAVRAVHALKNGQWLGVWGDSSLGPYLSIDHMLLAKGAGYPIFLYLVSSLPIGSVTLVYVIYCLGAFLTANAFRSSIGRWGVTALYLLLIFAPFLFGEEFSRIYRNGLVTALALLAVGISLYLGKSIGRSAKFGEWISVTTLASTLGLVLGWLWITRPDVQWVASTVLLLLSAAFIGGLRTGNKRLAVGQMTLGLVLIMLSAFTVQYLIERQNFRVYGVHQIEDFSSGPFARAVKLWSSVLVDEKDNVAVGKGARLAVYELSPTARSIREELEQADQRWQGLSCEHAKICDSSGPYFPWALRDAASANSGSLIEFHNLFSSLGSEINQACTDGTVACSGGGIATGLPPLDRLSSLLVLEAAFSVFAHSITSSVQAPALQTEIPGPGNNRLVSLWSENVRDAQFVSKPWMSVPHVSLSAPLEVMRLAHGAAMGFLALIGIFLLPFAGGAQRRIAVTAGILLSGWLLSLFIVAVFASTFNNASLEVQIQAYSMSSQSFLITGIFLLAWATRRGFSKWRSGINQPSCRQPSGPSL